MPTKPMLAVDFQEAKAKFPYIAMPKIDGVRGLRLTSSLTGRSLKPFGNSLVATRFSNIPQGLDGELTYGDITDPALCRTVTSIVNRHNETKASDLVLNVFDYVTPQTESLTYADRLMHLETLPLPDSCHLVPYRLVTNLEELYAAEQEWLNQGYEGVILRDPNAPYKNGRTTVKENSYLRIKRFVQEDAIVLSITEALENTNPKVTNALGRSARSSHQANLTPKGMVGSLVCRDIKTGDTITVGPGEMSHQERTYYFENQSKLVGATISYKSFKHGVKSKPRFPTFVSVRPLQDIVHE